MLVINTLSGSEFTGCEDSQNKNFNPQFCAKIIKNIITAKKIILHSKKLTLPKFP